VPASWARRGAVSAAAPTVLAPAVTLRAAAVRVAKGAKAVVAATVRPVRPGERVWLQKHTAAGWVSVSSTSQTRTGAVAVRVGTQARGTSQFRFVVPASATHGSAASATITVVVR
jgi:hypothetical protein